MVVAAGHGRGLPMYGSRDIDRWHELLNTRYVCELCLTRYFVPYYTCPACHQIGYIRPLISGLAGYARNDEELREIITRGQTLPETWDEPHDPALPPLPSS